MTARHILSRWEHASKAIPENHRSPANWLYLLYLADGAATVAELRARTGHCDYAVRRQLKRMVSWGLIVSVQIKTHQGSGRPAHIHEPTPALFQLLAVEPSKGGAS